MRMFLGVFWRLVGCKVFLFYIFSGLFCVFVAVFVGFFSRLWDVW